MSETVMAGLVWHCESCGRSLVEKRVRTGRYHVLTGDPVVERWLVCPRDRWWSFASHSRMPWNGAQLLSSIRRRYNQRPAVGSDTGVIGVGGTQPRNVPPPPVGTSTIPPRPPTSGV